MNGKVIGCLNQRTPDNWGCWRELDEFGTTNFITPEVIAPAAGLVRIGRTFSLAIPLDRSGRFILHGLVESCT